MEFFIEYSSYVLLALLLVYIRQVFFFYQGLARLTKGTNKVQHTITVIVPARNEEQNIERCLQSLQQQQYPKEKLSIIVIDDQSTDETANIVKRISANSPFTTTLFHSDISSTIRSPKIRALTLGIQHSASEIIVTTDADCFAQPQWVATLNSYFEPSVGFVTGTTIYEKRNDLTPLFWGIQFLEFLSYSAVGAGAIGRNRVVVSNGSNMAFRREAFDESGGFETLTHINTGDDSLLAQKIVENGKWKAKFVYEHSAAITTQPALSWKEVLHQRMRWVGQTAYYPAYMMFFMISTFVMFVGLFITLPLTILYWSPLPWIILLGKTITDYGTMSRFTKLTDTSEVMKFFIPTAIIHVPFSLLSIFGGYFFSFEWKERKLKKASQ